MNSSQGFPDNFLPSSEYAKTQPRLVPSYLQSECNCQLCAFQYNLSQRVPMMLCSNQHNCCLSCVKEIIIRKKQCPFCRNNIEMDKIDKNRMLCRILSQVGRKKGHQLQANDQPEKEFYRQMRVNNNNTNINQSMNAPDNSSIIIPDQQYNALRAALLNPRADQPLNLSGDNDNTHSLCSRLCQRIQLSNPLYCFAYFLVMFYNVPFFICEFNYALAFEQQACLDQDYGIGMDLRQWMFSSAVIGMAMFALQLLVVFGKIACKSMRSCQKTFTILNIIAFLLKFLGYNLLGVIIFGNIDQQGQADCSSSILAYMEAIFIIQMVIVCALCSFFDRRR